MIVIRGIGLNPALRLGSADILRRVDIQERRRAAVDRLEEPDHQLPVVRVGQDIDMIGPAGAPSLRPGKLSSHDSAGCTGGGREAVLLRNGDHIGQAPSS